MRLVVAEVDDEGGYRVLDEEREMTRIGEGLAKSGRLSEAAVERSLAALGKMKAIADGFGVAELKAIATSAVREAGNGGAFCREAWRRHRIRVDVITPEEEARLAFQSAARHFPLEGRASAVVDIGGGSVEIVLAAGEVVDRVHSLPLGAIRLTEKYVRSDPLKRRHWKQLKRAIDQMIKSRMGRPAFTAEVMIGSGGTFTNLAEMVQAQRLGHTENPHGYVITRAEVAHLLDRLREEPLEARRELPGLNPQRADIIVAGVAVVARLLKRLGCQQILVNERGVRDGLVLGMVAALPSTPVPAEPTPEDRLEPVRAFARKCRSNERHCEHVAHLAGEIFDRLQLPYRLPPSAREILQAAALLHDAGYLINHAQHHKHAYHLIMHGDLPGHSAREIELIANVARYHRRAFPKKSHANFVRLRRGDRRLVRCLAGILRVADGLDRTHTQTVTAVRCLISEGRIRLLLDARRTPQVEIWDAERKAELLQRACDVRLSLRWARAKPRVAAARKHAARQRTGT
jgi:exopolyphosphatase/guanosine-5'-triphosphate,3'-diphosphate pyrophosphatase